MRFASKLARTPDSRRNWPSVVIMYAAVCLFCFSIHFSSRRRSSGSAFSLYSDWALSGSSFNSGLTVCDEELRNGRWVSRYWDSSGQIVADIQIDAERQQMDMSAGRRFQARN